jgi:release factor glutamine methyltransferase
VIQVDVHNDKTVSPEDIMTIREAHLWASRFLASKDVLYPERNAEWILRKLLNWDSVSFLTRWNERLPDPIKESFFASIERRGKREPLQYILGEAEFYGRTFRVTPDVLIPRPETECLVDCVLKWVESRALVEQHLPLLRIVDIGVGSGAIAVTLALELQKMNTQGKLHGDFEVHAVDLSEGAVTIASENASRLGANVTFHHGNGLQPLIEKQLNVNVIVSNPPYITDEELEQLQPEVKRYEPHLALHGGQDGMDPYRLILKQSQSLPDRSVNPLLLVAFEVGHTQAPMIADMIQQSLQFQTDIVMGYRGGNR